MLTRNPAADRLNETVEVGCERVCNMMLGVASRFEIRRPTMQILVILLDLREFIGGRRLKASRAHGRNLAPGALDPTVYSAAIQ
jgi:hypothetical protein